MRIVITQIIKYELSRLDVYEIKFVVYPFGKDNPIDFYSKQLLEHRQLSVDRHRWCHSTEKNGGDDDDDGVII